MSLKSKGIGAVRAGDRWRDGDGCTYVVSWVGRMGVVGYRRADDSSGGSESVMDVVRFVTRFVPSLDHNHAA